MTAKSLLIEINRQIKQMDELYRNIANCFDLSDSALWIIYSVRLSEKPITQRELSDTLCLSKQTINSSLKRLIESGYIELKTSNDNKKNKIIYLTDKGRYLAEKAVDKVIQAESEAIENMTIDKTQQFINLHDEYARNIKEQFERICADK